jgi:hypothetical protein
MIVGKTFPDTGLPKTAPPRSREQDQQQENPCHSLLALSHPIRVTRRLSAMRPHLWSR